MAVFIDGYEIDVSTDETHTFDSMVTSDPVEEGSNITDNIKELPDSITLTGIVSDTPIGQLAIRRPLGEVHSASALERLLEIRAKREPVTIETNLRKYESMALERLSVPKNARVGDSLEFTATFKAIRIVTVGQTRVAIPRAAKKKKRGVAQTAPEAAPTATTNTRAKKTNHSWARQLR